MTISATATRINLFRSLMSLPALLLLLTAGCELGKKAPPPPPGPIEVLAVPVAQRDVPIYSEWIGILDGFVNADIRAQVAGYILRQNYKDGELVHKGDLLFEIDPRPFQATLDQKLATEHKSALDVARLTPLAKESAVTQQELDNAVQQNLADKANVDSARLNLEFTKILAPVEGIAGIANIQIGDLVGPSSAGNPLTTVSTMDPIKSYFNLSEQEYIRFVKHRFGSLDKMPPAREVDKLEVEMILADGSVYPLRGHFYSLDRQINAGTGSLRLTAVFANPGNILRPGQFARIRVEIITRKGALLIPQQAVYDNQGMFLVAVVGPDNAAHIRPVKVAERVGTEWIIEAGLKPGEQVVTDGFLKIMASGKGMDKAGVPVAVKPTAEAPAAKPAEVTPAPHIGAVSPAETGAGQAAPAANAGTAAATPAPMPETK